MTGINRQTPADIVVIGVLLIAIGMAFGRWWGPAAGEADAAVVFVGGNEQTRLPLHVDATVAVTGRLGVSTLQVADGGVRFVSSPCRHKLCVRAGTLHRGHDAAACVPNRVSVALYGGTREYDSINF